MSKGCNEPFGIPNSQLSFSVEMYVIFMYVILRILPLLLTINIL